MSIYTRTRIQCDDCSYEEPNDYNDSVKTWILIDDLESDRTFHFCSETCLNDYAETEQTIFTNRRELRSDSKEYRKMINW